MYLVPSLQRQEKTFVHRWLKHQHTVMGRKSRPKSEAVRSVRQFVSIWIVQCFLFDLFVGQIFQASHLQKSPNQASDYTVCFEALFYHLLPQVSRFSKVLLRPYFTLPGSCASFESGRFSYPPRKRTTKRKCTAWRSTSASALHRRVASFRRIAFWWRTALLGDVSIGHMGEVEWAKQRLYPKEKRPRGGLVRGIPAKIAAG